MPVAFSFRKAVTGAGLALAAVACQSNSTTTTETTATPPAAASAGTGTAPQLTAGKWRGVLSAQGQEIPFLFEVSEQGGKPVVTLRNGEERLKLDEISSAGDSTTIRMGVFDAALVVRQDGADKLKGAWVKYDGKEPYRVAFTATKGAQKLFPVAAASKPLSFDGTWKVTFKGDDGETYPAVGIFKQTGSDVTGTFLTTTGDYRYLAGQVDGANLKLSTFDGSHGFLFTAHNGPKEPIDITKDYAPNTLFGEFYSGKKGHETWTATPDPNAKLPDANALTGMKPGQKRLDFKFPNIYEGGSISPTDPKYTGKVVVVQILGSWCPNCMDETNFLAPWYEKNKQRGVEIIGLGYERTPDQKVASQKLLKMKERMNIGYDIAVAGQASAAEASKSLPQLAKVLAFPTTIFLDKKGEVRKIHTGYSGPGTGKYYEQEKADFNKTIDQLLAE
ncbi:TlpA family protein disulfide reductase [Hymenobacter lutimineralis]|uniref:TlpA family protein disulfide reductase n=1 Tax=Hymenobacter lutimineralis TaxID=2606448 RepID=A0A5D6V8P8_9BACT|nr:TlpA disulfide reductase family protein [Hymenobacter lutimineralis]TYZ11034.1 TlpA family protein disulfide reductase [Hymenobacter lutimineralis]